jgi:hypothetical protein
MNQRWSILYVDQEQPDPKKGEFNKEFGLFVGRYFSLTSGLKSGRVLDITRGRIVIKKWTNSKTQQWFFD